MINKFYGILMLGEHLQEGSQGYRYSDVSPSDKQRKALKSLAPLDISQRALFVDFLLKLLCCSPYWSTALVTYDSNSTYDVAVVRYDPNTKVELLPFNCLDRLLDWANEQTVRSEDYPYSDNDPAIDKAICKLLTVLTDARPI